MSLKEQTSVWYVVPLRIYVGYYFLQQGIGKFQRGFAHGDWITRQIGDLATVQLYPWYKTFLADYVAPNREIFGHIVTFGEIAVGAFLLLGLFTRFGALVGLLLVINYLLGPGMARGGTMLAHQQIFIVGLVVILLSNPGRVMGFDGLFLRGNKGLR